jgi:hypothetical protein
MEGELCHEIIYYALKDKAIPGRMDLAAAQEEVLGGQAAQELAFLRLLIMQSS